MSDYAIIGASAAGLSCAETIREHDKKGKVTVISEEPTPLYSRCLLTYLIGGRIAKEGLLYKKKDFYKANNITAVHGAKALEIDAKKKGVVLDNKKTVKFDRLLIATGASPKRLGIPGEDKEGVFGLRRIEDAEGIIAMLDKVETAVILGGGLIGLRDAYALRLRGKSVKVVVKSPQILSQMLDGDAAGIIEERLSREGIEIFKGLAAKEITGSAAVSGVKLDDGRDIKCQMVIIGKGVTPNIEIAKAADIKSGGGIVVDDHLMTSIRDIYAAGDVAEARDAVTAKRRINAIWPVAVEQGRVAGCNMAGKETPYNGSCMMNSLDFFGLATISMGTTKPKGKGFEELTAADRARAAYKKVILKDNRICGLVLVNRVSNAGVYGLLMKARVDVSAVKGHLLDESFDYAKVLPLIKGNPKIFDNEEFRETVLAL